MTVTHLGKLRGSRGFHISDGRRLDRKAVETHILTSDDGTDDEENVFLALEAAGYVMGKEWVGEQGGTNPGTRIVRYNISDHDATTRRWEVEVEYSSDLPDGGFSSTSTSGADPPNWEPEIEWDTELIEVPAVKDTSDTPIIFAVTGEVPAHPPIMKLEPIATLRYSRWYPPGFSAAAEIELYSGKTNSDEFLGFLPGFALMMGVSARAELIYGFQYWWTTYQLKFKLGLGNTERWLGRTLSVGSSFKDPTTGDIKKTDERGGWALPIDISTGDIAAAPTEVLFDIYETAAFNPLLF